MNRSQRRQQRHPMALNLAEPHNPDCPTAVLIAQLVTDQDGGWTVELGRCATCQYRTSVTHHTANVWVCLLCGTHGPLDEKQAIH